MTFYKNILKNLVVSKYALYWAYKLYHIFSYLVSNFNKTKVYFHLTPLMSWHVVLKFSPPTLPDVISEGDQTRFFLNKQYSSKVFEGFRHVVGGRGGNFNTMTVNIWWEIWEKTWKKTCIFELVCVLRGGGTSWW